MNSHPPSLVTVIIAFLNEEALLAEAIESVLRQRYPHWELLLVDDGSKDGSKVICNRYIEAHSGKIRYLHHDDHANMGLSNSRNLGLSHARGSLVAFLDADDVWLPEKLAAQVAIMNQHPKVAMVCEASQYWYSWCHPESEDQVIQVGKVRDRVIEPPGLLQQLYPLGEGAAPCPSAILVRREVALRLKGFEGQFRGKNQLYEDQAFLHKVYLTEPVYISSLCHNKYRQRTGSIVQTVTRQGNYHEVRAYFLRWLLQYMQTNSLGAGMPQELVRKALRPYRHPAWMRRLSEQVKSSFNRCCLAVRKKGKLLFAAATGVILGRKSAT